MKATASSILRKIRNHKHTPAVVQAATSAPQVTPLAESPEYVTMFMAIDRASHLGISSSIRKLALDAMIRLGEGDDYSQAVLTPIMVGSGAHGAISLREAIMTLMTMERAHRANMARA